MESPPVHVFAPFLAVIIALACAACGADTGTAVEAPDAITAPADLFDPTESGEGLPADYRQSVPRDAIRPVYAPEFVVPSGVDWPPHELVIGVDIGGEPRAYPVGFLTHREMVIDDHRGTPTLVTW